MKKYYTVTGMTCSACSSGIERTVAKIKGVTNCSVSLMTERMLIESDEDFDESAMLSAVRSLGYGVCPEGEKSVKSAGKPTESDKAGTDRKSVRFLSSICFLIQLLCLSMGPMLGLRLPAAFDPTVVASIPNYVLAQCLLAITVIAINFSYFKNGFAALIKRVPNMDTLVAIGSASSFIYSLVLHFQINSLGGVQAAELVHNLYYESSATILTLVTLGKWIEDRSKRKTGEETEKLLRLAPDTVTVERNGVVVSVALSEVRVGDTVLVRQGESIPVDGQILEGHSFVDKSAITGESLAVEVSVGDYVTSASVNGSGALKIRAEKVGEDTMLSSIIRMVRNAGGSKAPIQKLADRVAGVFVPTVMAISLLTFILWKINHDFATSINYAISVLVISCPCALGLATPVAVVAGTGKGASLGILYKDAESLQKMQQIQTVILDKTATLTQGKPTVTDFIVLAGEKDELSAIAAGIEENSNHPLAECVRAYAKASLRVEDFEYVTGKGAVAKYDGSTYALGNRALAELSLSEETEKTVDALSLQGKTVLYLSKDSVLVALIAVADALKPESVQTVKSLKEQGVRTVMLTGDNRLTAQAVASEVGVDEFYAEVLPEDKLAYVLDEKKKGVTAMVGDGINDSPALKEADVGIAMGNGTDVAIESADVVLVGGNIACVAEGIRLSRATVRNIRQNLFWAFCYNVIGIPIAAGAFVWAGIVLNPMFAAFAMSLSSVFVCTNAACLTLYRPKILNNQQGEIKMKKTLSVVGMMCKHCQARVEKALLSVEGVTAVKINLKKGLAEVELATAVENEVLTKSVVDAGYEVTKIV